MGVVKKVLVDVDSELWGRVRARALQENALVGSVVGKALRGYLSGHFDGTGSVARAEVRPAAAAEREDIGTRNRQVIALDPVRGEGGRHVGNVEHLSGQAAEHEHQRRNPHREEGHGREDFPADPVPEGRSGTAAEQTQAARQRPSVADLRALVERVAPGTVVSPKTRFDHGSVVLDELRVLDDVPAETKRHADPSGLSESRSIINDMVDRKAERQRIARQNHLRTHPEDASQDPSDDEVGF